MVDSLPFVTGSVPLNPHASANRFETKALCLRQFEKEQVWSDRGISDEPLEPGGSSMPTDSQRPSVPISRYTQCTRRTRRHRRSRREGGDPVRYGLR